MDESCYRLIGITDFTDRIRLDSIKNQVVMMMSDDVIVLALACFLANPRA